MTGAQSTPHRVLVVSHAHPDFSLGGGELAAYNLFQAYKNHGAIEQAWFLARADKGRGATGHLSQRREGEFLWEQSIQDWHMLKAQHRESLTTWFTDLVKGLRPTVVHAHHYSHLGLEFLQVLRRIDPSMRIILTLHEYMAICRRSGQMVKTGGMKLCHNSSPDECHQCFPDRSPEDFWLREHFIKSHFALVDHFVAPSAFLKQRYVSWGLPEAKISVIENGQSEAQPLPPRPLASGGARNRFGFFGQINQFKGLTVLLESLTNLPENERKRVVLEVHGANLEIQQADFQQRVRELAEPLMAQGVVRWVGPYRPEELPARMGHVDWVVVPSIWWENSPMVIQEAWVHGRPVICSDIGGMQEKVTHGVNGLHVAMGNTLHWGETLCKAAGYTGEWDILREGIRAPLSHQAVADEHLRQTFAPSSAKA
jgi:glycosyltransferase involved in cell wall biosynthesis